MSQAQLKKYAVNALFVIAVIAVANTIQRRVPVAGPFLGQVMQGL